MNAFRIPGTCPPTKFTLGLREGGLQEDPEWRTTNIRTVEAATLDEAKQKWAEETGHTNPRYWDKKDKTYWGWEVIEVNNEKEIQ